ncbi:MAG: carbon storage regulator [Oscillospiraceae bacterium]|jgi:carbon storage regulator|nr:carbon storage regulator [Oscillospiraceae bacterium]
MLVISRRIGESFLIGDDIEATVIDITGEKVVLGIAAPKSMLIARTDMNDGDSPLSGINRKGYGRQYRNRLNPNENDNK